MITQKEKHFKRKEKVLGQFFTPPEVAKFIVSFSVQHLDHRETNLACDPACGYGIFLRYLKKEGFKVYGFDIDPTVKEVAPLDVREDIVIKNGLSDLPHEGEYDIVVGNPPFSAKYGRIDDDDILSKFELGKGRRSQAIEVLFLEKFFKCARKGGIIGVILPYGIFSNTNLKYVRDFILQNSQVLAIIALPRNTFYGTSARTAILFAKKGGPHKGKILMACVTSISHLALFKIRTMGKKVEPTDSILYPEFYLQESLELKNSIPLGELVKTRSGQTEYGKNRRFSKSGIPFISAKVVTPLGIDFEKDRKFVSPSSEMYKRNAYAFVGEIVFVRVGVGTIGRVAVITSKEEEGIVDDWSYILTLKTNKVNPYYLAFYLQSPTIKKQILKYARGVGTITIPQRELKKIPVIIPPQEFLEKCEQAYKEMIKFRKEGKISEAKKILKEIEQEIEKMIKRYKK
jgi:type I restriction enzyme M protein